jgi:hypothetical protein
VDKDKTKGEYCIKCGIFVDGHDNHMCCNSFDCGCMGMPTNPCFCSEKCYNEFMEDNNIDESRRA